MSAMSPVEPAAEELRARLTAEWDVRGIDVATLAMDPKGTIVQYPVLPRPGLDPLKTLPPFATEAVPGAPLDIELGRTIGEGGMGIVWSARQTPLRREVAVKSVHPRASGAIAVQQLLLEARVTGSLEHPNVVPIHALGRDEKDRPIIVMKRIEGKSWQELLDAQHRDGRGTILRELDRHLQILLDVARAASFAHARGILHRDIKPSNVMIGSVGEVYLADWGIAASLLDDPGDLALPRAREVRSVCGSPAYMAPEMACGNGARIDERTDVYLLGATLHEVLTGVPPHDAETPVAMLTRAYASTPTSYAPEIPSELVAVVHRAMHRNPAERFASASDFAKGLEQFLEHQDSLLLAQEASAKLDSLRDALATAAGAAEEQKRALYHSFNECRFGFLNALRIWADNGRARGELQTALELMIGYELDHGSAGAAATLLAELPDPRPRLAERIERKNEQERLKERELERLKAEVDPTARDRERSYLAFIVAAAWGAAHGSLYYVDLVTTYAIGHYELCAVYLLFVVGSLASGFALRDTLLARAAAGLKMHLSATLCYAAWAGLWPVCRVLEVPVSSGFVLMFLMGAAMLTLAALTVDRRRLSWALGMGVGLGLTLRWPDRALLWMGIIGSASATLMGVLRWRTRHPQQAAPLSERWAAEDAEQLLETVRYVRPR
jgi:serine/threonine-protein kinase